MRSKAVRLPDPTIGGRAGLNRRMTMKKIVLVFAILAGFAAPVAAQQTCITY
jgi:hypothetical protein